MKRSELKQLVKECLLEIIIEGSPKTVVENVRERNGKQQTQKSNIAKPAQVRRPALDHVYPNGNTAQPQKILKEKIYKEITGNNELLAEAFADTAASGLVDSLGSHQPSNPVVDTGFDPTLFEGSSNWAKMAFSGT